MVKQQSSLNGREEEKEGEQKQHLVAEAAPVEDLCLQLLAGTGIAVVEGPEVLPCSCGQEVLQVQRA